MIIKKLLRRILIISSTLCLSACGPDLGVFEKEDGYKSMYESFGDVEALYDGGDHSYEIDKSLFNNKTVEEFSWEKSSYEVVDEEYLYIIIPTEKELNIECIILFFLSPYSQTLEYSFFYFKDDSSTPSKIKYLTSPDTEPEYDDDGNYIGEKEIEYDDPPRESAIARGSISLVREEWNSTVFGDFNQEAHTDGLLHTNEDGYIYLRIENNSGFNRDTLTPIEFTFINLMIRAV